IEEIATAEGLAERHVRFLMPLAFASEPWPKMSRQPRDQGHSARDPSTLFGRGEDPRRTGRAARGGEHRRTLSPRGHRLVDVLWLAERVPGGRQEATRRRHGARRDLRRGEGSPPRSASVEGGRGRSHPRKPIAQKTYGPPRPVCKGFDRERRKISLLQRIRPRRVSPGQDGDTRAPVLIKRSASSAAFLTRLPKRRSTVRPSRYRHSQTSSIEQRPEALIDQ